MRQRRGRLLLGIGGSRRPVGQRHGALLFDAYNRDCISLPTFTATIVWPDTNVIVSYDCSSKMPLTRQERIEITTHCLPLLEKNFHLISCKLNYGPNSKRNLTASMLAQVARKHSNFFVEKLPEKINHLKTNHFND